MLPVMTGTRAPERWVHESSRDLTSARRFDVRGMIESSSASKICDSWSICTAAPDSLIGRGAAGRRRDLLADLTFADQLRGVIDLLGCKFHFWLNFHAPPLRGPHPGASAFPASDLSSSASTRIICYMAWPVGVTVSIASVSEWKFKPQGRFLRTRSIRILRNSMRRSAGPLRFPRL